MDDENVGSKMRKHLEWDHETWFMISRASVFLFVFFGLCTIPFVCFYPGAQVKAYDVAKLYGSGILALVTFATVAWRGMVASQQADEQKRQNAANDRAHYADLLERGTKLLDETQPVRVQLAGAALLNACIADPRRHYANQAMDVLAEFYQRNFKSERQNRAVSTVRKSMIVATMDYGVVSDFEGTFDVRGPAQIDPNKMVDLPDNNPAWHWPPIIGYRTIKLYGGTIFGSDFFRYYRRDGASGRVSPPVQRAKLRNVTLQSVDIPPHCDLWECKIENCEMKSYRLLNSASSQHNRFFNCNFSGARLDSRRWIPILESWKKGSDNAGEPLSYGNWFYREDRPRLVTIPDDPADTGIIFDDLDFPWGEYFDEGSWSSDAAEFTD